MPAPGEISLAHNGVLFLDELPEFNRSALEILREPLETGWISIARARGTVTFPARIQLIAAMNPCPCGYRGDPLHECRCTPDQIRRYSGRVSPAPCSTASTWHVELAREHTLTCSRHPDGEHPQVRKRPVLAARQCALDRAHKPNARLDTSGTAAALPALTPPGRELLDEAADKLGLSRRACNRSLRVARTIADLAGSTDITANHMAEALNLRPQLATERFRDLRIRLRQCIGLSAPW